MLEEDPFSGALFAFRGRRGGLIKLLWYDGQGLCLYSKRLEKGHFVWPVTSTGRVSLTPAQLSMLVEENNLEKSATNLAAGAGGLKKFVMRAQTAWCDADRCWTIQPMPAPLDPATLPGTVTALRDLLLAREAEHAAELQAARNGLKEQVLRNEQLKQRLARLLRERFGASSEKLRGAIAQLELMLGDLEEEIAATAPPEAASAEPMAPAPSETTRRKPARRPLPEALPRDIVEHPAPCTCPDCGGALRPFGEDVTEILDYVPGSFRVIRHVRPKLSCRMCETIVQAPAPNLPIRRGRAGAGLLAHVLVAKYCDHLPLHRQAEIYAREDIDLSRSTLADMVGQVVGLVRPLIDALAHYVMAGERVHADDTEVPVLEPGLGRPAKPGCGPTCAMDSHTGAPTHRRSSIVTRRTAKEPTHTIICAASRASCRPTAMADMPGCISRA